MADNLLINTGADASVATEDVGGVHHQKVKMEFGLDGAATMVSASDPLPITPAATELHLGEVGGKITSVSVEFTRPNDTTPYSSNDVVSNDTSASTLMAFASLMRVNAGTGYIVGARLLTDKKSITPRFRVHIFNDSAPTRSADNAQHKAVYADHSKRVAVFDMPAMTTAADTTNSDFSGATDFTLRVPVIAAAGTTTLYALLEALDAFTPAALEKFRLILSVDNN